MIYDLASEYSPWVIAKYIGLPYAFVESLTASSQGILAEIEATEYGILTSSIELKHSHSMAYGHLVQAVFEGYLGHEGWLRKAEKLFNSYLNEFIGIEVVTCSSNLIGITFRNLERVKLSLRDALLVYSYPVFPPEKEKAWKHIRAEIDSDGRHYRLIEASIYSLSCDLSEDLTKLCHRFSAAEQDDEYYSLGRVRGDFTKKLDTRIAKEVVFNDTVRKDVDRLIYALKRGGYRHPEIIEPIAAVSGKRETIENIRQRYSRTTRRLRENWSRVLSH